MLIELSNLFIKNQNRNNNNMLLMVMLIWQINLTLLNKRKKKHQLLDCLNTKMFIIIKIRSSTILYNNYRN